MNYLVGMGSDVCLNRLRVRRDCELDMIADPLAHVSVKGNLDRVPAERALDQGRS